MGLTTSVKERRIVALPPLVELEGRRGLGPPEAGEVTRAWRPLGVTE